MILKRGVTYFTAGDVSLERDFEASKVQFKKASFAAVQAVGGHVLEWFEPDVANQYPHMHVQLNGEQLYIFHNQMYDYIAFSLTKDLTGLRFIDSLTLAGAFPPPYEVLTVAQLQEPLRKQKNGDGHILLNANDLNDVELYYMDYFSAQTVGDLVFNYWD